MIFQPNHSIILLFCDPFGMAIKEDSVRVKTMKKKAFPVTYVLSFGQNREGFWKEFSKV